jgi:hypothetical protein
MRALALLALTVTLVLSLTVTPASAQQPPAGSGGASVTDLKAPPSPAFVLLDVAPTKVERPQTVRPLIVSALTAAGDDGLPRNYAVEFAPYWLGTPELSFDDYYNSGIRAIPRFLSVSVATTPLEETLGPGAGTAVGLGARTLPLPGKAHPQLAALRRTLVANQRALNRAIRFDARRPRLIQLLQGAQKATGEAVTAELSAERFDQLIDAMRNTEERVIALEIELDGVREKLLEARRLPAAEREAAETALRNQETELQAKLAEAGKQQQDLAAQTMRAVDDSQIAQHLARGEQLQTVLERLEQAQSAQEERLRSELRRVALAIQSLDKQRVGPLLAVAGAVAWAVPDEDSSRTSLARWGLWLTPGYRMVTCATGEDDEPCVNSIDVLGVVRYIDDRVTAEADPAWELGARVVWQPIKPLAMSMEWLGRAGTDADPGNRLVGVAEYRLNEDIYLYASFGRDFEEPGTRRNLVSTIGLTFGFGSQPIVQ